MINKIFFLGSYFWFYGMVAATHDSFTINLQGQQFQQSASIFTTEFYYSRNLNIISNQNISILISISIFFQSKASCIAYFNPKKTSFSDFLELKKRFKDKEHVANSYLMFFPTNDAVVPTNSLRKN